MQTITYSTDISSDGKKAFLPSEMRQKKIINDMLIGSLGTGKSSFGSFSCNLNTWIEKPVFKSASDTSTTQVQESYFETAKHIINVFDTPGLNNEIEKDLEHYIDIVRPLTTNQ